MRYRLKKALDSGVPMTNYGLIIAFVQGILPRAIEMFPDAMKEWKKYFDGYERSA